MRKFVLAILLILCCAVYAEESSSVCFCIDGEVLLITNDPSGFACIEDTKELGVGESLLLDLDEFPGATAAVSDSTVVSISGNKLTAKAVGEATLRIYVTASEYYDQSITVKKAPRSIKLAASDGKLKLGQSYKLEYTLSNGSAGRVSWESGDTNVVKVDDDGTLHAVGVGICTVKCTTYNGQSAHCKVTCVMPEPAKIELESDEGVLFEGETLLMGCSLSGGYNEELSFASTDTSVARVDETGRIYAVSPGEARIYINASGGDSKIFTVTVKAGPKAS